MSNCPKCGEPTGCMVEQGKSISTCWCYGVKLTPSMLEELDTKYSGECLCEECLRDTPISKLRILMKQRTK